MNGVVIVGTGGQARELHALLEALDRPCEGFVDDDPGRPSTVHGLPLLGDLNWLDLHRDADVVVGIGAPATRHAVVSRLRAMGVDRFPTLVHPDASVGPRVELGIGVYVCPGAVLTTDVRVGDHVLVNFAATIGHDALLEDHVTVAPGVHVSGAVTVGQGADVGTGAALLQGVQIGAWSIVGAGAVVREDVEPNTTVVGVPAREIARRETDWQLG